MKTIKLIGIILCPFIFSISFAQNALPYKQDSVLFYNRDSSIRYGATITMPLHGKNFTAIVLVSGTGKQDRDGSMAGHPIFSQIADYLTRKGFAVLRMDDRGVGQTTGKYEDATTEDFANDALVALHYLQKYKNINPHKIGLLGHSEGGAAISIAAAKSKDVAFLISIAGLAMNGLDALIKQNEDLVNHSVLSDTNKVRSNEIDKLMFITAYEYADSANMKDKLNETYDNWKKRDDAYFNTLNVKFDHFRFPVYSYIQSATTPWYRYFIRYNAQLILSHIKVPVLALNGDKDLMVSPDNLKNWENYLSEGGNKNVTTVLLPGLNHLFLHCETCQINEYGSLHEGFSLEALNIIDGWLKALLYRSDTPPTKQNNLH
ncbi:alpha/beta hydrolase [Arachidicoccus ginsenosidimutans]|uniref:alpha/beta hydrolase family protein n=1 Tax=Arachidicoccus sp. BS20 TaxID=1850526 RepID=UPI0007F07F93|nr:alpha/beta hydrolase [Arachidicoccus sp. BS20]ANI88030.1 alpha/beta hydrolase [Arachidicoccus sp. BS20]